MKGVIDFFTCSNTDLGSFLGMEVKRGNGLFTQAIRQRESEYYLWSDRSFFPFVQLVTDMETGGVAFLKAASSLTGTLTSIPFPAAFCPVQYVPDTSILHKYGTAK